MTDLLDLPTDTETTRPPAPDGDHFEPLTTIPDDDEPAPEPSAPKLKPLVETDEFVSSQRLGANCPMGMIMLRAHLGRTFHGPYGQHQSGQVIPRCHYAGHVNGYALDVTERGSVQLGWPHGRIHRGEDGSVTMHEPTPPPPRLKLRPEERWHSALASEQATWKALNGRKRAIARRLKEIDDASKALLKKAQDDLQARVELGALASEAMELREEQPTIPEQIAELEERVRKSRLSIFDVVVAEVKKKDVTKLPAKLRAVGCEWTGEVFRIQLFGSESAFVEVLE